MGQAFKRRLNQLCRLMVSHGVPKKKQKKSAGDRRLISYFQKKTKKTKNTRDCSLTRLDGASWCVALVIGSKVLYM